MNCTNGEHLIAGPAGDLQIRVDCPATSNAQKPVVLICHPHPLYGGSLQNKVVHMLAKSFTELGMVSVRFNFRGVGQSQGEFDQGVGEQQDALAVAQFIQQQFPQQELWLAGFSFGAFVCLQTYEQVEARRLLLVSPPATLYDLSGITNVTVPWTVIQGGEDEVIEPAAVREWLTQQRSFPTLHWLEGASHFFHGRLNDIRAIIQQEWQPD